MTMKYKAYSQYKDSGVEWLGDIPSDWKLCRLKFMARIKNGQDYKAVQVDHGYPVIGSGGQFTHASTYMYDKPSVLLGRKGTIDKPLFIDEPFWTVDTMYYTEVADKFDTKYLYYLALTIQFDRYSTNTALPSMTQEHLGNFTFAIPDDQQHREKIANFLDHETAKIDTLIEKQQQLIKLLKEKRQAVISHAVTKGLNPDVPMRDSGVEWLGEVPEHWVIARVKNVVTRIVDGPHFSPKYVDEGYMFISARNIKVNCWSLDDAKFISEENFLDFNKRVIPEKGDVLLTKGGTTGVARAVDLEFPFQVWVHVAVLKTIQSKMDPFYFAYALNGTACYEQSQQYTYGATNNDLGLGRIAKIFFPQPPIEEQREMRLWIDEQCSKFDGLISKGLESIELMQERRTALISAAVTGKIDVRNWQPPKPVPNEAEASLV